MKLTDNLNSIGLPVLSLEEESPELKALIEFGFTNHLYSIPVLPVVGALIARHSGPEINGITYPSNIGDLYSVGGHSMRVRYIALQLYSGIMQTFFPKEEIIPTYLSEITTRCLGHDLSKVSVLDQTRKNIRFDPSEKRRIVEEHTLLYPALMRQLLKSFKSQSAFSEMIIAASGEQTEMPESVPDDLRDISYEHISFIQDVKETRRSHQIALYYAGILHHVPYEGYPDVNFLVRNKRIPPENANLINQILFELKSDYRSSLQRMLSANPWERSIANTLIVIAASDILDGIFSHRPHYHTYTQRNRNDRFNDLELMLRRTLHPELAEFIYYSAAEIYADSEKLHQMAVVNYRYLLQRYLLNPLKPISIPQLIQDSLLDFIHYTRFIEPVDYHAEFDAIEVAC